MLITPTPGITYSFTFTNEFAARNGIYTLVKLMTYDEYLADGGDLFGDVFSPVGLTGEDMNEAMDTIRASKMMKLVSPDSVEDTATIFMPTCYAEDNPDHNVSKYMRLGVTTYIGVTKDPALLNFMKEALTEYVQAVAGIDPKPQYVSVGNVWLTDQQYEDILAQRDESKLKIINYYSENARLQSTVAKLEERLKVYEELIVQQYKLLNPDSSTDASGG